MVKRVFLILMVLFLLQVSMRADATTANWSFEISGGNAYSIPLSLRIEQEGESPINIQPAVYETRAFDGSPYYTWRVSRWQDNRSWELELIHHKIHLVDVNDYEEIQRFDISHGYNLITINRGFNHRGLIYRIGGGIVLTHPHFTVRNVTYPENYGPLELGFHLSGPAAQVSIGRQQRLFQNLYLSLEGKITAAYAVVNYDRGSYKELRAEVPNIAIHGVIGFGYHF